MKLLKSPLFYIVFFMLIKGIFWMNLIPPLQSPDEQTHFAYVQYIGEENKPPILEHKAPEPIKSYPPFSDEMNTFIKSVHFNDIAFKPDNKYVRDKTIYEQLKNPSFDRKSNGDSTAIYPPFYYYLASIGYKLFYHDSIFHRFYTVRFISVLLSLICVILAYFVGKKISPDSLLPSTLAILLGLQPMFSLLGVSVNNDILMDAISIALLLWMLYIFESVTTKRLLCGGVLIGIGILTKPQMFFIGFVFLMIVLIHSMRKYDWKFIVKSALTIAVPIILIYSPWAIYSFYHYHSIMGPKGSEGAGTNVHNLSWYLHNALPFTDYGRDHFTETWTRSFWAKFGWLDTRFTTYLPYKLISFFVYIGIIGSIYGIIRKKENYRIVLLLLTFTVINLIFLYAFEINYFLSMNNFMLQGRYLFTSLLPILIIFVYGYRSLLPDRFKNYTYLFLMVSMLFLHLASIDLIYSRYY